MAYIRGFVNEPLRCPYEGVGLMRLRRFGAEAAVTRIGRYVLGEVLGEGPLGKAYEATDSERGEKVVIRGFARPPEADDEHWQQAIGRFQEALTKVHKLQHPNVVRLIDFGEIEGMYYIATEYFVGRNLRRIIDEEERPSGDQLVQFLETASKVFQFADIHGISHGDITPYNILFPSGSTSSLKILNYGVAQVRKKLGSPYLAPEQLTGFLGDIRSDFYSLGVVAYEWASKKNPFQGETIEETGRKILSVVPAAIEGLSDYLNGILQGLMAKDPKDRYSATEDLIRDLRARQATKVSFSAAPIAEVFWEPSVYQPPPTLADYSFQQADIKAIHRHLQKKKAIARAKRKLLLSTVTTLSILTPLTLLFLHAVNRYNDEGAGRLTRLTGQVQVLKAGMGGFTDSLDQTVGTGDVIRTGKDGKAVLSLPEGSRLLLSEGTTLSVRALGSDGGARRRSFGLAEGTAVFAVRPIYGTVHRFVVRTPHLRAEVKGTGFEVRADENLSSIGCVEGRLSVEAVSGSYDVDQNKMFSYNTLQQKGIVGDLTPDQISAIKEALKGLDLSFFENISHWLADAGERFLVDPILTVVGTVQAGREIYRQAMDDAQAQSMGLVAIRAICLALEGGGEYPTEIGLTDLSGLGLDQRAVRRILSAFAGNRLLSYQSDGRSYQFTVQLLDTKKTLVTVQNGRMHFQVPEQPKVPQD